jgi:hypothetical protein
MFVDDRNIAECLYELTYYHEAVCCSSTVAALLLVRTDLQSFFAKMPTYPDLRFREFFDPRYLKKLGLRDRDIAFENC